jgi:hypothetical protein
MQMQRTPRTERRHGRSPDTLVSLCRLLDAARRDSGLSAVALADETGCLVAGSGAQRVCEELAAISSLPANDPRVSELGFQGERPRVRQLRSDARKPALLAAGGERSRGRVSCQVVTRRCAGQITLGTEDKVSFEPGEAGRKTRGSIARVAGRQGHLGAKKTP